MLTSKFWEEYFTVYDYLNELIPYRNLLKEICNVANIQRGDLVLDLGSGTGNLTIEAEKLGANVKGIDFSKEGIKIHKKKNISADVLHFDITHKLPFSDDYFDVVISNNVLYTIAKSSRSGVMNELYRIMKPNGRIVISNIIAEFKPVKIYFGHIRLSIKESGLIKTFSTLIWLIYPTIKIMYYNFVINREHKLGAYDFFRMGEQKSLLELARFRNISSDRFVYANQALLNSAIK